MATTAFIANIIVWKFAWFMPLHRQVQMLAGQGVNLDRGTLSLWGSADSVVAEIAL